MKRTFVFITCWLLSAHLAASVPEVLERSGTRQMLDYLPGQFTTGLETSLQEVGLDDQSIEDWTALAYETFAPEIFLESITSALESELTEEQLEDLVRWYETPLSQRITRLEIDAQEPEMIDRISASIDSILADQHRLKRARQINDVVEGTDRALQMARASQNAMLTAMLSDLPGDQKQQVIAEAEKAIDLARGEIERYVLASIVLTYMDLSDEELESYVEFLGTPAARTFYRVTQDALITDFTAMSAIFGAGLADIIRSAVNNRHFEGAQ